jgi:hypothetical protein
MFNDLEEFFKAHQYTTVALGVIGTFSAVVVSLTVALLSQRANRTRIKALASISIIMHSTLEGKEPPTYITISIRNVGVLPAVIPYSFFRWRVPFSRGAWIINPWDGSTHDEWVPQKRYPVEINPRHSQTFFLADVNAFRDELKKMLGKASFFERCCFRFLKAEVLTDDGKVFRVKLDWGLRTELRAAR